MNFFHAIAAMSLNRVIGRNGQIPWHLSEDLQWFKKITSGNIIVMGRKTFQSIGRPLPNRETVVLSRSDFTFPGVQVIHSLDELNTLGETRRIFICGGAQLYALALPRCSDLYLTVVKKVVEGDTFFPQFEEQFQLAETILEKPDFQILHYRQPALCSPDLSQSCFNKT